MTVAEIIKTRRKALGLTLEQIAQYAGVEKATVWKWEHGQIKQIGHVHLRKLAEALGVDPMDLIYANNE